MSEDNHTYIIIDLIGYTLDDEIDANIIDINTINLFLLILSKIFAIDILDFIKNKSFLDDTTYHIFGKCKLIEMVFLNNKQINTFKTMINFYDDVTTYEKDAFKYYKNIFNRANFNILINLSKGNIPEFIKKLDAFSEIKDSINFDLLPNKHAEIITSTDNSHKSISFTSIRVNSSTRISPGCPAISSFIKALFIKNDP